MPGVTESPNIFPRSVKAVLDTDIALRGVGAASFVLHDASTWQWWHYCAWAAFLIFALEVVSQLAYGFGWLVHKNRIAERGKHLDAFEAIDIVYICFGKIAVTVFTYHLLRYVWFAPEVAWDMDQLSLVNCVPAYLLYFLVYDVFYYWFHRALHLRAIYGYVHKHHHRQKAPSRGNLDAINVHPFELVTGEYIHLLAVFIVARVLGSVHIASVLGFILTGGFLAALNHTRFDLQLWMVYQVKFHDVHHWYPNSNYGQYTMLYDWLASTFKPYPEDNKKTL